MHITQLLPPSPLSCPRQDTVGTPSPAANPPGPRSCTHIPGQGLPHKSPTRLGVVVVGAAPASR